MLDFHVLIEGTDSKTCTSKTSCRVAVTDVAFSLRTISALQISVYKRKQSCLWLHYTPEEPGDDSMAGCILDTPLPNRTRSQDHRSMQVACKSDNSELEASDIIDGIASYQDTSALQALCIRKKEEPPKKTLPTASRTTVVYRSSK